MWTAGGVDDDFLSEEEIKARVTAAKEQFKEAKALPAVPPEPAKDPRPSPNSVSARYAQLG